MKQELAKRVAIFMGLVALAAVTRMWREIPNFHAVTAVALFAGFYFRSRAGAALVPLTAMVASDFVLGGYTRGVMIVVYASLLAPIACRTVLRDKLTAGRVALASLAASALFFMTTNGAVWYAWYPHTLGSLAHCYAVALPFFANALAGDLLFSALLFGGYALATTRSAALGRLTLASAA